jgi:hypothetical protein
MKEKSLRNRITSLFKKWYVKRPNGQCQILFSLTELDNFVDEILSEINWKGDKK